VDFLGDFVMLSAFGYCKGPKIDQRLVHECMDWLCRNATPNKTIRPFPSSSSYRLKHLIEEDIGEYVGSGVVIQALINLGWKIKRGKIHCRSAFKLVTPRAIQLFAKRYGRYRP